MRPWKILLVQTALIIIILVALVIASKVAMRYMDKSERMDMNILSVLNGQSKSIAKNGSEIATTRSLVVTYDEIKRIDQVSARQLSKRLDEMDVKLNRKIESITLTSTNTVYSFHDSTLITTDTSYETHYKDLPWLQFDHKIYPDDGGSDTYISTYDSIAWVVKFNRDTLYRWPKRLFKPRVPTLILNNFNPHGTIGYVKQYRIE